MLDQTLAAGRPIPEPLALTIGSIDVVAGGPRQLLSTSPWKREGLADYARQAGRLPPDDEIFTRLAGITGRGGAGFPFLTKVLVAKENVRPTRFVVINGEEGEPSSCKDRYLLRFRPHMVLDGAMITANLVGAGTVVIYVSDPVSAVSVHAAIAEVESDLRFEVVVCPASYVAGEASSIVRFMAHGDARPTDKPPFIYDAGIDGEPTLVSNVETFAAVAYACRNDSRQSTFLATVSDGKARTALLEVPYGAKLSDLAAAVGATGAELVVAGGLFGGVLPTAPDLGLETQTFRQAGSSMGCAAFIFCGDRRDVLTVAAEVAAEIHDSSARQCGSCINGTRAVRDALRRMALGNVPGSVLDDLQRWATGLRGRGACALPDGAAVLVNTLLRYFETEMKAGASGEPSRPMTINWNVGVPVAGP